MPTKKNTSAAGQPASATPRATPLRQTRARSRLDNAPRLMSGLDHRGQAIDPLSTDPESIIFDDVVKQLRNRRKKKIIFRHRSKTPESPTVNVRAAKRAQLKRKAPVLSPVSTSSSPYSRPPSPRPLSPEPDSGMPFYPRSQSSSPLRPEHDGGAPLNSPSQSSSSGSEGDNDVSHDSSTFRRSRAPSRSLGSSHSSGSSRSEVHGGLPPRAPPPSPDADEDTSMESGLETIYSLPPFPGNAVHGFDSRDGFWSQSSASPTRQPRPEDVIIPKQVDEELSTGVETGSNIAVAGDTNPPTLSGDDEGESPRAATRRIRPGCAGDSLRKRRRSEDDGSAPLAIKKPRVEEISFSRTYNSPCDYQSDIAPRTLYRREEDEEEEEEDLYSPTYSIPVTEQSDINPIPSPTLTATKIPGLAFLETQNVSINTDNVSPKVLTPVEPPADFDSEIPGIYGSGKRPRLHYDWYEQYHRFGPDCQKVHGCQHGLFCHQCHADWHKAWSHFFKKQDEIDAAAAATADYDIRKGYLGTALGFAHSPMPVIEPIPPRGGKIRTHPARIAKEKLALMERMAKAG